MAFDAGAISGDLKFEIGRYQEAVQTVVATGGDWSAVGQVIDGAMQDAQAQTEHAMGGVEDAVEHGVMGAEVAMRLFPQIVTDFMVEPMYAAADSVKEAAAEIWHSMGEVAEASDQMRLLAERAGVSIEWMSLWSQTAKLVEVDATEFGMALKFLQRSAAEAADGNKEAIAHWEHLGISMDDVKAHLNDTGGLFEELMKKMQGLPNNMEAVNDASELLGGRMGDKLIPMFKMSGTEVQKFQADLIAMGATETETSGKMGEDFAKNKALADGLSTSIAKAFDAPLIDAYNQSVQTAIGNTTQLGTAQKVAGAAGNDLAASIKGDIDNFTWLLHPVQTLKDDLKEVWEFAKLIAATFEHIAGIQFHTLKDAIGDLYSNDPIENTGGHFDAPTNFGARNRQGTGQATMGPPLAPNGAGGVASQPQIIVQQNITHDGDATANKVGKMAADGYKKALRQQQQAQQVRRASGARR